MGRLITQNNIQQYFNRQDNAVLIKEGMILSPSALDYMREHQIKCVYEDDLKKEEELECFVRRILSEQYNIREEKIVKAVLERVNQIDK